MTHTSYYFTTNFNNLSLTISESPVSLPLIVMSNSYFSNRL